MIDANPRNIMILTSKCRPKAYQRLLAFQDITFIPIDLYVRFNTIAPPLAIENARNAVNLSVLQEQVVGLQLNFSTAPDSPASKSSPQTQHSAPL